MNWVEAEKATFFPEKSIQRTVRGQCSSDWQAGIKQRPCTSPWARLGRQRNEAWSLLSRSTQSLREIKGNHSLQHSVERALKSRIRNSSELLAMFPWLRFDERPKTGDPCEARVASEKSIKG